MASPDLSLSTRNDLRPAAYGRGTTGGVVAQFWAVVLRPAAFFGNLEALQTTRHWLWIGLVLLALVGFSAVKADQLATEADSPATEAPGTGAMDPGAALSGGGPGAPGIDPGMPAPGGPAEGETNAEPADVAASWSLALEGGALLAAQWVVLALLLIEVSFLSGKRPRPGLNLQIAIWASVPLGLMATLQLVYFFAGGAPGEDGVAGMLPQWGAFREMGGLGQDVVLALASRLTLFWLWSLALVYAGSRYALKGRRLAALSVVLAWVVVLTLVPALFGHYDADAFLGEGDPVAEESLEDDRPSSEDPGGQVPPIGEVPNGERPGGVPPRPGGAQ